jgi:hypothetical protein
MIADATLDRSNIAVVLARLGSELSDWAASAKHIEDVVLPSHSAAASEDIQQFDALVQHLDQVAAFVLRLSAATDDGAGLTEDDVERLARATTLSALRARLTGNDTDISNAPVSGEVEIW